MDISGIFLKLLTMSLMATAISMIVMLLGRIFGRLHVPRKILVMLWMLVFIRAVCPFELHTGMAMANPVRVEERLRRSLAGSYVGDWKTAIEGSEDYETAISAGVRPQTNFNVRSVCYEETADGPVPAQTILNEWVPAAAVLWALGVLIRLLSAAISYSRLRYKLRFAVRRDDNVYLTDQLPGPCVVGFINPRIYILPGTSKRDEELIIAHERGHIRRGDMIWKFLGWCALTVHWMNPWLWLAYKRFCADLEGACDEYVIRSLRPKDRIDYGQALLNASLRRRGRQGCPMAFGEQHVKERVKAVLTFRKPGHIILIAAIVLCLVLAVLLGTNSTDYNTVCVQGGETPAVEYTVGHKARSFVIYEETFRNGFLVDYEVVQQGSFHVPMGMLSGTLILQPRENPQYDHSVWMLLDEKTVMDTDGDVVIAARYMSNGSVSQAAECAVFNENKDVGIRTIINDYEEVVLTHFCISPDDLNSQYNISPEIRALYAKKTVYIGNHIEVGALLQALGIPQLGSYTMELQTTQEPYELVLHFEGTEEEPEYFRQRMMENATVLLALIDNCGEVAWTLPDADGMQEEFRWTQQEAAEQLGCESIKAYGESPEALQELILLMGSQWTTGLQ